MANKINNALLPYNIIAKVDKDTSTAQWKDTKLDSKATFIFVIAEIPADGIIIPVLVPVSVLSSFSSTNLFSIKNQKDTIVNMFINSSQNIIQWYNWGSGKRTTIYQL